MEENSKSERTLAEILKNIETSNEIIINQFKNFTLTHQEEKNIYFESSQDLRKRQADFINWQNILTQSVNEVFKKQQDQLEDLLERKAKEIGSIKIGLYEPTQITINRLENFIKKFWKIPLYILLVSIVTTGLTTFLAIRFYKESINSKQEVISEYRAEILKNNVIIPKKDKALYNDMLDWFEKNLQTRDSFINWRNKNK